MRLDRTRNTEMRMSPTVSSFSLDGITVKFFCISRSLLVEDHVLDLSIDC
jgi:hypothetical protein